MSAQPVADYDPDDPVEILRGLPARYHEQFLAEYEAAVAAARHPEQYRQLHDLLRLWRLGAIAFSDPGFEAQKEAARTGSGQWTPIADIVPDWDTRVAAAARRQSAG